MIYKLILFIFFLEFLSYNVLELEFLIERCYENMVEYENQDPNEELINFILKEEEEMNQFYMELESSLHTTDQFDEYRRQYQQGNYQN